MEGIERKIMGKIHKHVTDLGIAAYVLMHGYKVIGKQGRTVYFEMDESEVVSFERLALDYLSSDYHRFDSCLMSIKKIGEYMPNK
jgi:hypothetical protein